MNAATYAEAEQYIKQHAGPDTYRLSELTAAHGEDEHEIRLDPTNRVIWWAYDNTPLGGEGWTVDRLTPADAARDADAQADLAEDRLEADDYEHESTTFEQDQDLLDEYAAILALSVAAEPQAARTEIARRREVARREELRWQRAYGVLVTQLVGDGAHGAKARASRALGISGTQVQRILEAHARLRAPH